MSKVWLITGSGNGLGTDIAEAALAAGDSVVAGARRTSRTSARARPRFSMTYGHFVRPRPSLSIERGDEFHIVEVLHVPVCNL